MGGVETNSQAPYYIRHPRYRFGTENLCFHDQKVESATNAQPAERYGELSAARIADIIAANYGMGRGLLDEYALVSRHTAIEAAKGQMEAIVPIIKKGKKGDIAIDADEALKTTKPGRTDVPCPRQ